jgi:hypothetical protein
MSDGKLHDVSTRATTEYRKGTFYLLGIATVTVIIVGAIAWAIR